MKAAHGWGSVGGPRHGRDPGGDGLGGPRTAGSCPSGPAPPAFCPHLCTPVGVRSGHSAEPEHQQGSAGQGPLPGARIDQAAVSHLHTGGQRGLQPIQPPS